MLGVGGEPHLFAETGQEYRAAYAIKLPPLFQEGGDRHQVNRFSPRE